MQVALVVLEFLSSTLEAKLRRDRNPGAAALASFTRAAGRNSEHSIE